MATAHKRCRECGGRFEAVSGPRGGVPRGVFCSGTCKQRFYARADKRARAFYHLVMEMRFDRTVAQRDKAWSQLCTLAGRFRDDDKCERAGRISWTPSRELNQRNSAIGR